MNGEKLTVILLGPIIKIIKLLIILKQAHVSLVNVCTLHQILTRD